MSGLKLWGGNVFRLSGSTNRSGQRRCLVAAPTKKGAVELLNASGFHVSMFHFRGYFTETGNQRELECLKRGEGVWLWPDVTQHQGDELIRIEE